MQEGQGSRTADRVAERRAAHQVRDRPLVLDDPMALRIIRPEVARELREHPPTHESSTLGPYLRAFFAMRSRFAEDALAAAVASGVRQYVVLGAGFDTFAYRNPFPELRVFEVDHPDTQAIKRERLAEWRDRDSSSLTFVPIDFTTTALDDAMRGAGFDERSASVFFLARRRAVPRTAGHRCDALVHRLAAGQNCASSSTTASRRNRCSWTSRLIVHEMAKRVAAQASRGRRSSIQETLLADLRELGFSSAEDFDGDALNRRYFAGRSDKLKVGEGGHMAMARV